VTPFSAAQQHTPSGFQTGGHASGSIGSDGFKDRFGHHSGSGSKFDTVDKVGGFGRQQSATSSH